MPEIVKEKRKLEPFLDQNSKNCLKNLCDVLENLQYKVDMSMQFDFKNIQNSDGNSMDFNSIDGVKYASMQLLKNQDIGSTGIFGGAPATGYG